MTTSQPTRLASNDVPQANVLARVLHLVQHLEHRGDRHAAPGFNDERDVHYYTQAARILGLIDVDLAVTDAGRRVLGLSGSDQCSRLAGLFAATPCGAAWLAWAGVDSLGRLDPGTASAFLAACSNFGAKLRARRASTLRRWLEFFLSGSLRPQRHPRRGGKGNAETGEQLPLGELLGQGPEPRLRAPYVAMQRRPRNGGGKGKAKVGEQLPLGQSRSQGPEPRAPVPDIAWPDARRFPHNEAKKQVSDVVEEEDLMPSRDILVVAGYASLDRIVPFLACRADRPGPQSVRLLFGNEPFPARRDRFVAGSQDLEDELRDYWLHQGISPVLCAAVLRARALVEQGLVDVRLPRSRRPLHAKIFVAEGAVTVGSSNFTHAGFGGQSEGNVRFEAATEPERFSEGRALAEGFWATAADFRQGFIDLLDILLKPTTWQEALARACASVLEGEWAKRYVPADDPQALERPLWPHQRQGLAQALWILENVGSVVIADATGSGKTRMGAWIIRGAYDLQLRRGGLRHPNPLILVPPPVVDSWQQALHETKLPLVVESHGPLSNREAGRHKALLKGINDTELLVVDEAHNFMNPSHRTDRLLLHYADHALLFTATPINREESDLVSLIELLGADNLDDDALEAFGKLKRVVRSRKGPPPAEDLKRIRREIEKFMVRRTRSELNQLANEQAEAYRLPDGRSARYPRHHARYYPCDASESDAPIADEINDLAAKLTGVARIGPKLELPRTLSRRGMTEEDYVKRIVRAARGLAMYFVRDCLRSSPAALYEHIHGTDEAAEKFEINAKTIPKDATGNVLGQLEGIAGKPPRWRLSPALKASAPAWLWDPAAHAETCAADAELYVRIAALATRLSGARERAKVNHLFDLQDKKGLVLAFDSHLISLAMFKRDLEARGATVELFTGQSGAAGKRKAQAQLGRDAPAQRLVALCSDALSEGLNLQGASCVVHLDTPTVIRTAEQRAGRVDRMNSRHDDVEIWWPRDPPSFAPRHRDRLRERHVMVTDLIGSNLELPGDMDGDRQLDVRELADAARIDNPSAVLPISDAFRPVRALIGKHALVPDEIYAKIRTSQAKVGSGVSTVRSASPWAFCAVGGRERDAPRWVFFESICHSPVSDLAAIADLLRERLASNPPVVPVLEEPASALVESFTRRLEDTERELLPVRRRRALELAERVLGCYSQQAWEHGDLKRHEVVQSLLTAVRPNVREEHPDPRSVADAWIRLLKPYRERALRDRPRTRKPWTLTDLEPMLLQEPIPTEALRPVFDGIEVIPPAGNRVVAIIVGVPEASTDPASLPARRSSEA
ncbi:SNF2-related protein [Sorangium sp. So ce448]|uniref:SNF2-related protein n=1 Tax=Sorangium sp. So ce448 TaxID=3133314 RepID=UPI003F61BF87